LRPIWGKDMDLIQVKNLSARYFKAEVITDLNLVVRSEEIITILGSNGAGKTTTLRAISGIKVKKRGTITFEGKNIQSCSSDQILRRGIAHVPEGRGIFPFMSVNENLKMGAYTRSEKEAIKQDEERVLGFFPILRSRYRQTAGTLSGGEQQMLALARALMANPKLLMLDEPSLGLAPLVVADLSDIIVQLRNQKVSVLLVEQNSEMALGISDRGYVLENGRIALEGIAADLLDNPYVKEAYLGG